AEHHLGLRPDVVNAGLVVIRDEQNLESHYGRVCSGVDGLVMVRPGLITRNRSGLSAPVASLGYTGDA
ncbi:MAG: hypothetical protein ABI567_07495, partial [Gammaproteobacteria bacterium]